MNTQEYIEQLSAELKKLVGVQPVGKVWIDLQVPQGGIPFLAQEVSRSLYADLLKYVQDSGQMKTEAEWQEIYAAQDGYVPYYSDGDGVNTFRMPSMGSTYPQFASSLDDVRVFVEEGLPNITGRFDPTIIPGHYDFTEGAFFGTGDRPNDGGHGIAGREAPGPWGFGFDASRSNSIYGNSVHVTPKTGKILIGVYAIGVITNVGSVDISEFLSTLDGKVNRTEFLSTLEGKVNRTGDTMTGNLSVPYLIVLPTDNANEGGELRLDGAGSHKDVILDNYQGNHRVVHFNQDGTVSSIWELKDTGELCWQGKQFTIRTISTSGPSGGVNGEVWFQYV